MISDGSWVWVVIVIRHYWFLITSVRELLFDVWLKMIFGPHHLPTVIETKPFFCVSPYSQKKCIIVLDKRCNQKGRMDWQDERTFVEHVSRLLGDGIFYPYTQLRLHNSQVQVCFQSCSRTRSCLHEPELSLSCWQLLRQEILAFHGTWCIITVIISACHWCMNSDQDQSIPHLA